MRGDYYISIHSAKNAQASKMTMSQTKLHSLVVIRNLYLVNRNLKFWWKWWQAKVSRPSDAFGCAREKNNHDLEQNLYTSIMKIILIFSGDSTIFQKKTLSIKKFQPQHWDVCTYDWLQWVLSRCVTWFLLLHGNCYIYIELFRVGADKHCW